MEKEDVVSQINENMEYLEKSNKLIEKVKKYFEVMNEVENVEKESEVNG